MTEADFLKLLKSGFHKLAAGRLFELVTTNETKRLFPLDVEPLTPEKISAAVGNFGVYVRPKVPRLVPAAGVGPNLGWPVAKEAPLSSAFRGRHPEQ